MRHLLTACPTAGATPQSAPLPGRMDQVRNDAGGYVWTVDPWTQLERFLILGTEGGTYYVAEHALTLENTAAVQACLALDGLRVVRTVVEISTARRALKNEPALFVLAMAASPRFTDGKTNARALAALPKVARTGTHLCAFATFVQTMRGWGRSLRAAVAGWYLEQSVDALAYQMLKYQSRVGWTHRDLLRVAHPKPAAEGHQALFRWAVTGELDPVLQVASGEPALMQVEACERVKRAEDETEVVRLIEDYRLTHEMVPSQWKQSPRVWEALLDGMPYLALVRHLSKLTAVGLLVPHGEATAVVASRLTDRTRVMRAGVHPIALLAALLTYKQGRGMRGHLQWVPAPAIIDALDEAFYLAFESVEPSGKRICLALDASGSMQSSICTGLPFVSAAMASAALAMAFARTEPHHTIMAFHDQVWPVDITRKDRLDRACAAIVHEPRATDASLPIRDALRRGIHVDAFVVLTDSETWAGPQHPAQALIEYREATGIAAKLIVVAMAANRYSIADPRDPLQLDVAGFDTSVPAVLSRFLTA